MARQLESNAARAVLAVVIALLLVGIPASAPAAPPCSCPIEGIYETAGTWAVSQGTTTDQSGNSYALFYPTDLGSGGFDHPIITWGNGTGGSPDDFEAILTHFASWGFVVIASDSGQTGHGTEILAGADWMTALNGSPTSVFYQQLDTAHIGAAGHSQGAGGAVNATILSEGSIVSTLPISLPDPRWWTTPLPDWSAITTPVHFFTGSVDGLSTDQWQTEFYNSVTGPAAKAALRSAGHNVVQKANNGYLGYAAAWFLYTLTGDTTARSAFVGDPAEVNINSSFVNQAQRSLL